MELQHDLTSLKEISIKGIKKMNMPYNEIVKPSKANKNKKGSGENYDFD